MILVKWSAFGKELLIRLNVCSFVLCLFVVLVVCNFDFEGVTVVLIAPIPDR